MRIANTTGLISNILDWECWHDAIIARKRYLSNLFNYLEI
jgi:hypothetical protein